MHGPLVIRNTADAPIDSLSYTLFRSRRRTISVEVQISGAMVVRVPMRMPLKHIESFLLERIGWVLGRLERARTARVALPLPGLGQMYVRGELHDVRSLMPRAARSGVAAASTSNHRKYYRKTAASLFPEVIADVLPLLGVHGLRYAGLKLRTMKRRWGSCTGSGWITLNDLLMMTPDHCIRAVVVHELCHLVHMDHGPAFRQMTLDLMPDITRADAELDAWSAIMALDGTATPKEKGAQGPFEVRTLKLLSNSASDSWSTSLIDTQGMRADDYASAGADSFAHSWSNEPVSADAIISGVRPSM